MPRFDGTGPRSMGPMTGGCRGYCAVPPRVKASEFDFLKYDLHSMREKLAQIEARIDNLGRMEEKVNERSEK